VTTTTIMFTPKSLLLVFVCCVNTQTFYHTSDIGGSYTRVSHGTNTGFSASASTPIKPAVTNTYHQPAPPPPSTYHQPAATFHQPAPTFHQPAPTFHQPAATFHPPAATYHQPAATFHPPAATHHQPAATYHQPAATYHNPAASSYHSPVKSSYGDKCVLDYTDEDVQICVPTLDSDCSSEKIKDGISITEQYDCRPITRTVCTEYEDYDQIEVCAVSFSLQQVDTSAKLVDVDWVKECKDEVVCQQPHSHGAYHKDSYCKEQIKSVCYDSPVVRPVERKVVLKLPQPYEVCIIKEIVLPRVKCTQISENKCSHGQRIRDGEEIYVDKCSVNFGEEQCHHSQIRLPKQGCLKTLKQVKNVYEEE